jgi:hypothetical protein
MKKLLLVFALLCNGGGINPLWAQQQIPMHIIDQSGTSAGNTLAPPRPWYITQDDYVLTMPAFEENLTLQLLDEDETVVYSTYVPAGTTQVVLPTTLSGEFELRLIPFNVTYYYRGFIVL